MLTAIVEGYEADIWFLIALILFAISCVWHLTERAIQPALVSAGLALLALAFLVT